MFPRCGRCRPPLRRGRLRTLPVSRHTYPWGNSDPNNRVALTFSPTNPKIGALVHINIQDLHHPAGTAAFNAVGPHPAGGTGCTSTSDFNTCPSSGPIPGVCVQVFITPTAIAQPKVRSVTPTDITFEMPAVTCSQPITVTVKQTKSDGTTTVAAKGRMEVPGQVL